MNEELITKFLDGIGTKNETVAVLKDPPEGFKVDDLVDDLATEFKKDSREVFANNPDVIQELEIKAKGKARGSVERKIKKIFNISSDEWNDNELEKDYEKALTFGFDKMKTAGSKSVQEINTELQEANTKLKWYKEDEVPRIQEESDEKADKKEANSYLRGLIADSGKLIVSEGVATTVVTEGLRKKGYTIGLDETKTGLTIKTKDGLSPQDDEKTRNLTKTEVIKSILESEKLIIQSQADPDPTKKPIPPVKVESGEGFVHPNAIKNVEDLKEMNTSGNVLAKQR